MKNTIKFAALGAMALAASSSAALAGSELLPGITAGLALGAPLPEGVYDISIGAVQQRTTIGGVEAALPVWLIWSTPYQIAGGRIGLDGTMAYASVDTNVPLVGGANGFQNGLTEATIKWNLQNGFNVGLGVGVWWASDSALAESKTAAPWVRLTLLTSTADGSSAPTPSGAKKRAALALLATSTTTWPQFVQWASSVRRRGFRFEGPRRRCQAEPVRSRWPRWL